MTDHTAAFDALADRYRNGPAAQIIAARLTGHALLALAEQQRAANLIAYAQFSSTDPVDGVTLGLQMEARTAALAEAARLIDIQIRGDETP